MEAHVLNTGKTSALFIIHDEVIDSKLAHVVSPGKQPLRLCEMRGQYCHC